MRPTPFMIASLAGAALLCGCSSTEPKARVLSPGDFVGKPTEIAITPAKPVSATPTTPAAAPTEPAASDRPVSAASAAPTQPKPVTPEQARENVGPTTVRATAPTLPAAAPAPMADSAGGTIVDAKIGDVNNRAVYASSFLSTKAARLRNDAAERLRANPRGDVAAIREQWREAARKSIGVDLNLFIAAEILRAEALSSFTPEQKVGLRAYLTSLQADLIRQSGGSRANAEERITSSGEAGSLDEYEKKREQSELVKYEIDRSISRKVQVPWRDIKMAYEARAEHYNPPPVAKLRVILVSAKKTEAVDAVTAALAAGKPFEEVAASNDNILHSKDAGLTVKPIKDDFAKGVYFGDADVNTAVQALSPGAVAGPIKSGTDVWWVKLEAIERNSVSLYDAQQELDADLRAMRKDRLLYRYLDRLKSRASFTDLDEMIDKLVDFATDRYFEPALAEWKATRGAPTSTPTSAADSISR